MSEKGDQYQHLSFGRFLQKKRLEKGLRLADVARQTKIRVQILLSIEAENHPLLPAEPYVKGLLKAFANVVGADTNEVLKQYQQDYQAYQEKVRFQSGPDKASDRKWLKLIGALGLLLILATVFICLVASIGKQAGPNVAPEEGLSQDPPERSGHHDGPNKQTEFFSESAGTQRRESPLAEARLKRETTMPGGDDEKAAGYLLSVYAVKNTWLKVIADEQKAKKYHLQAGDRLDLAAISHFNILIGNAEGVKLMLNDRTLHVSGKSGQIVNIEIP